ncbi:BolA family protein [Alteromonas oceanisediminis]|uniref:BolA family protein n=1 Tax=Alteromonas oceanisediminis TaxID=2836180 RepID=UPI001BDB5BBF|nr:BolA family protein [Alteromonas oceanisediminis]MBT0585432.1 BolA family transcriptional regulator [Alteromonas oceanisediminis]
MTNEEIELLLKQALNLSDVHVRSEGTHFQVIAVSDDFADMSRVKRQQAVYAPLKEKITDGSIHAVTIKTFTEKDWKRERMFNMPS